MIGGGAVARGRAAARARRARCWPSARCRRPRDDGAGRARRTSAASRGCSAPRCWRWTAGGVVSGRLVVCPTPIGNLEDVTLRVLSALREADVVACEDTRRTRVLLDRYGVSGAAGRPTTSTTRRRGRRSSSSGCRRATSSRWCRTPGMPLVSDPGFVLVRACVAAGLAVEVLPGPVGGAGRAGGVGPAGRPSGASRGSCRARRASCARCFAAGRDAGGVRVAAPGAGTLAVLAAWTPRARSRCAAS